MSSILIDPIGHQMANPMEMDSPMPIIGSNKIALIAQERLHQDDYINHHLASKRKWSKNTFPEPTEDPKNEKKPRNKPPSANNIEGTPALASNENFLSSFWNHFKGLTSYVLSGSDETSTDEGSPSESIETSDNIEPEWLTQLLAENPGYPWDQIKQLSSALAKEQLVHLWNLCQLKHADYHINHKIFSFARKLAAWDENLEVQVDVDPISLFFWESQYSAKETLGKLIYLIDQDILATASLISPNNLTLTSKEIDRKFALHMTSRLNLFNLSIHSHQVSGIQNFQKVKAARIPVEIADALITTMGCVNIGIASALKEAYLGRKELNYPYEIVLSNALSFLEKSSDLRRKFLTIKLTEPLQSPSSHIIRICLGLPAHTPLMDNHLRKTALSGLLSHLRQGSVSSCFATAFAIEKLRTQQMDCLEDFSELLNKGKLTRKVGEQFIDFIFLPGIRNEILETKIELDREGKIIHKENPSCRVWEAPGIIAACRAAGIDDIELFSTKIISELLRNNPKKTLKITIQSFLEKLISLACDRRFELIEGKLSLVNRALFAFEAQTQNPLQRIWENALAGMAEARTEGLVKSSDIDALINPLHDKLKILDFLGSKDRSMTEIHIKEELIARLRILFDPNIVHVNPAKDDHSTHGGFVSYDTLGKEDPFFWQRVDNAHKYIRFIYSVLKQAQKKQMACEDCSNKTQINNTYLKLLHYIQTKPFLRKCLRECHHSNMAEVDVLEKLPNLKHTPWLTVGGNNEKEIDRTYNNDEVSIKTTKMTFDNTKGCLSNLINFAKKLPTDLKRELKLNPHLFITMGIEGKHSFSALLGHPTMVKAWTSDYNTTQWIEESVIRPGEVFAESITTPLTRSYLSAYVKKEFVKKKDRRDFEKLVENIPDPITIRNFRKEIADILKGRIVESESKFNEMLRRIDGYLVEHALPLIQKEKFVQHIVHFADTNWDEVIHDLHFCFLVNPGNGELEVWRVQDDNRGFLALDQDKWVKNKTWDISLKKSKSEGV